MTQIATPPTSAKAVSGRSGSSTWAIVFFSPSAMSTMPATIGMLAKTSLTTSLNNLLCFEIVISTATQ